MDAFPDIRAPLKDGWSGASPDGVRKTPMDAGPSKKRVESVAVGAVESFNFRLPEADATTLEAFYATNKALRFHLDHWIWGACTAEFDGPISWGVRGAMFTASLRLEIFR